MEDKIIAILKKHERLNYHIIERDYKSIAKDIVKLIEEEKNGK